MHPKYWTLLMGSLLACFCSLEAHQVYGLRTARADLGGINLTLSCKDHNGSVISIDLDQTYIRGKHLLCNIPIVGTWACQTDADEFYKSHLTELLTCNGTEECTVASWGVSSDSTKYEAVAYRCVPSGSLVPPVTPSYSTSGTWTTRYDTQITETTDISTRNHSDAGIEAIVAGTVGSVAAVIAFLAVIAVLYCRRKKRQMPTGDAEFKPSQSEEGDARYVEFPLKPKTEARVNGHKPAEKSDSVVTALGDDVTVVYHNIGKCGDAPSDTQQVASQSNVDGDMILTENDLYETRDYEGGSDYEGANDVDNDRSLTENDHYETIDYEGGSDALTPSSSAAGADPAAATEEDEADNDMILTDNYLYEAT